MTFISQVPGVTSAALLQPSRLDLEKKADFSPTFSEVDSKIVQSNANNLWNRMDSNFDVDASGKLIVIAKWQIFKRLWKWIRNSYHPNSVTNRVNEAVKKTLVDIIHLNQNQQSRHLYVWDRDYSFSDMCCAYSPYRPAYYLLTQLHSSHQFKSLVTQDLIAEYEKQEASYPISREKDVPDPKIFRWDDEFCNPIFFKGFEVS